MLHSNFPLAIYFTHGNVYISLLVLNGLPRWHSEKESASQCRRHKRCGFHSWVQKIPWRRKWQATAIFLPEKSQGQRSLAGCSSEGRKESDTTEQLLSQAHTQCIYISAPLNLSHPLFPLLCPQVHCLRLCPYSCPADRFISTIFLDSVFYSLMYDICFSLSDLQHPFFLGSSVI